MENAMKLKLSEYAQIAEIVSAFAIVLSLIFVGFQLKDNAKATRSATANATVASIGAWYAGNGQNEQASAVLLNGIENPDSLSREQWFQFAYNMHALLLNFQNSYYLVEEGTLDQDVRDSQTVVIAAVKDQPGFLRVWSQRRDIFFPEFQTYVDAIIASDEVKSKGLYRDVHPTEDAD
jgi:hypothetical protein